jgi:hypothetical protein
VVCVDVVEFDILERDVGEDHIPLFFLVPTALFSLAFILLVGELFQLRGDFILNLAVTALF